MDDLLSLGTEVATWAIKDFSVALRQQITRAARLQDCTVAEWLHGHFQRHGVDGQMFDPVQLNPVVPSGAPERADAPDALSRLIAAACELAAANERLPDYLRSGFNRRLQEQQRALAPPRQRRLTSPDKEIVRQVAIDPPH
jgi:hypothetical protein